MSTTVLMGVYRPHFAMQAIESVIRQTEVPHDVILMCGGDVHTKIPRAMEKVATDRYLILGDDDWLSLDYIEKTSRLMDETGADVVSTHYEIFGDWNFQGQARPWSRTHFLQDNCSPFTSLVKTEVYKALGGFAREAGPYGDWDFWWRAFEHGFKNVILSESLFHYRTHREQHSQNVNTQECRNLVLNRHLGG